MENTEYCIKIIYKIILEILDLIISKWNTKEKANEQGDVRI